MSSAHGQSCRDFVSYRLCEWAAGLCFEDLSEEAVGAAKRFLFDSVGCALGGSQQEIARIALDHFREMGGIGGGGSGGERGGCSVIASDFLANPVDASFLNALMVRAMDYNDIYWKADPVHPSDLIAGPLALCEWCGGSGKDLLLGIVIAYEVEMRLAEFGRPGVREYGWHHATLSSFASPIAAGRMMGLSAEVMQQAVGISGAPSMCLGAVTAGKLTNMKNAVDPMATRAGVEAAMLAARGFSGPEHVMDGKEGFTHCFEKFGGSFDLGVLTDELPCGKGDHFKILDCGMKSFPIEALSHAPLTAMMKCVSENGIGADDVAEIVVEVIARAADILGDPAKYRPRSKETADHSLPYSMAVGLVDGMVTPLQFKEERIMDSALEGVMDMVKVVANEEFEALFPEFQPSRVTVVLKDGKEFCKRVDVPKGDPRDAMTEEEIAVKFNALGSGVFGEEELARLRGVIMGMEGLGDVGEFCGCLRGG